LSGSSGTQSAHSAYSSAVATPTARKAIPRSVED
jgi:hypothetical protein